MERGGERGGERVGGRGGGGRCVVRCGGMCVVRCGGRCEERGGERCVVRCGGMLGRRERMHVVREGARERRSEQTGGVWSEGRGTSDAL